MHIYDIIQFIIKAKKRQNIEKILTYFYIKIYINIRAKEAISPNLISESIFDSVTRDIFFTHYTYIFTKLSRKKII